MSLGISIGNSGTSAEILHFQGLSDFFQRSLFTLVSRGYMFPGLYRTFLSLPDRHGLFCVASPRAKLGLASLGSGPSQSANPKTHTVPFLACQVNPVTMT